jgi:hypothetical protein
MTNQDTIQPTLAAHGAARLPAVEVEDYNVELKDEEGFVGDRASKGAFREFIEAWRKPLRELGEDRFGDEPAARSTRSASINSWRPAIPRRRASSTARSKASRKSLPPSPGAFSSSKSGSRSSGW